MKYKYLLLDLDFTLLNNNREISEENRLAILKATEVGVKTVICTGRSFMSAERFNKKLELDKDGNYSIAYNGGVIYQPKDNKILIEHKLDKDEVREIIKNLRKFDISIIVYMTDKLVIEKRTKEIDDYCKISKLEPIIIGNFDDYIGDNVSKILIKSFDKKLLKTIEAHFQQLDLKNKIEMFYSSTDLFEFNPKNVDKGSALVELANYLGESTDCFIACGDNFNDISMVKNAGLGVAMKNGVDEIKAIADYVTQNSNDENAIKEVIEKFILNNVE